MLGRLIQFALTQRVFVLLVLGLLALGGTIAFRDLPIDAFPDVSSPQVKVIVKAPGMTPREVEQRITAPIEVEMLGIPRQTMLRSIAKYAVTVITVDFEEGTDVYWARQQVAERCLACGNCTAVCPTCFCHRQLAEGDLGGVAGATDRVWDSCFSPGHSLLGGRPLRSDTAARYRQWLTHKFCDWEAQYGRSGCVGCGRCIAWCPVGIDVTGELADLLEEPS